MVEQDNINSRRIWTSEQWQAAINGWHLSGLTIESYCRQQDITSSAFRRWHRKLKVSNEGVNGFIPVHVEPESEDTVAPPLEVVLANGHRLFLQNGIGWEALKDFLKQLLQ